MGLFSLEEVLLSLELLHPYNIDADEIKIVRSNIGFIFIIISFCNIVNKNFA
ncbi:hypothetical protein SDC9_122511 [bioreactor metagenome]|uniref:Uncharacterized protein n=1 Tax=bioreactor metagenome TaxID=1076179 RepID=A0A645CF36_9ZZZZ